MSELTIEQIIERCDEVVAHAWMVRTFIKHSEECEDYPEMLGLMGIVRAVFDTSRALETRSGDPAAYLHMLRKKIGKLKKATEQFSAEAVQISAHTNFVMAVKSIQVCVRDLELLLEQGSALLAAG
jgi:CHAD domain-containing protein